MSLLQEALDACAALTRRVEHLEYDKVAQALEITKLKRRVKKIEKGNRVRVLKLRRLKRVGTSQRVDTSEDAVMDDASTHGKIIDELDKDDAVALMDDKEEDKKEEEAKIVKNDQDKPAEVHEVVDVITTAKLITEVVTAASETVTAASTIISTAEPQVLAVTITAAPARVAAAPSRRRKRVVIRDPEEESTTSSIIPTDTKSKDKGKGITVEEPKPLKKRQQIKMNEEYARKLHAKLNKYIDWDVAIDHVKQKAKEDPAIQRYQVMKRKPQTEAQARKNMIMYLKNIAGFRLDYFKGMSYDDILQKAAKRRKLSEEVEDLKRHLEIVPDEDDDVYTEATPLARKVHVVDYEIIDLNNKPYYKNIRADGTQQLFISFLTLLKNFDREDLEALCTGSSLEESKDYPWSSKGQKLEATGIVCAAKQKLMLLDNAAKGRLMLLSPERPRVYSDLSPEETDWYNTDIRAINILLQGLPKDIYTLINHYTDAKDTWDNVKMLLEGSELTKEDRESQLNIKMTMSRMQLNSKFVNNMLPEWGRFVTAVKLNRGLRDSNYDQLYAYLKQHKTHDNENKMMLDQFTQHTVDPLALMSNVSHQRHYSQSSSTSPSTYVPPHLTDNAHLDSGLSLTDN
nr:hypothetical protein [Tanacetum cinerariifolium]